MKRYVSYIMLICIIIVSCDDILEEDITDNLVTVISPLEGDVIEGNSVQFRWDGINGADEYRLQINNEFTNTIVLDSLITTTIFNQVLDPNEYSWRVRGENFAYVTPFSFNTRFIMTASDDLTNQVVALVSPSNNFVYGNNQLPSVFSWESISSATSYHIKVSKVENGIETVVFEDDTIDTNSTTITDTSIQEEGVYKWAVKASNESTSTNFSLPNTFSIDNEGPPIPELLLPVTGDTATVGEEVTLTWEFKEEGGTVITSGITSEVQFSNTSDFQSIESVETVSNTELIYTFDTAATFYWRVRGKDNVDNYGDYSEGNQIIVN